MIYLKIFLILSIFYLFFCLVLISLNRYKKGINPIYPIKEIKNIYDKADLFLHKENKIIQDKRKKEEWESFS